MKKTLIGLDAKLWNEAIKFELQTEKNKTWNIESLLPRRTMVNSKWLFKVKLHANGSIEKYRVGLVVRGFSQIHGIN